MVHAATLWANDIRKVALWVHLGGTALDVSHCCPVCFVTLVNNLQFQLALLDLGVDFLPQLLALFLAARLYHVYRRHLVDCLVEILRTVTVGSSEISAGYVGKLWAAAVAVVALPVLRKVPWRDFVIVE